MPAYYNEIDPFAAQWLRNLISAGLIAPGDVDERSIVDVRADDLRGYEQCHFFAGIGGWSYALKLAGWPDDRPVWTGSCPCQPFSAAGKLERFSDDRHLWPTWVRLIEQRKPPTVFGEQVASATEWLRLVRGDLEALGYAVGAIPIEAASAGADHLRDRFWFVAHSLCSERRPQPEGRDVAHGADSGREETTSRFTIRGEKCRGELLADADDTRSQGRSAEPERAGEQIAGPDGVAGPFKSYSEWFGVCWHPACRDSDERGCRCDSLGAPEGWRWDADEGWVRDLADANEPCESDGRLQRIGQQRGSGSDQETRDSGDVADSIGAGISHDQPGDTVGASDGVADARSEGPYAGTLTGIHRGEKSAGPRHGELERCSGAYEWVIGADGKARRVKSGVRLLVDGFPARVGLLRGFGNAIDPRPAAQFIAAADEAMKQQ